MKKQSKLSITPNNSKNDDFTLSLVDFFYDELSNRGISSTKKASYLEIQLPNLYEEKYSSIIVDCTDGKIYLRGQGHKDKMFGRLSRFNPQRKSDAYNCVNYSVTRLVNRLNKLFESSQKQTTASVNWVTQKNEDGTEDSYVFTDNKEEALIDSMINPDVNPENGVINIVETENPQEMVDEVIALITNGDIVDLRELDDLVTDQFELVNHQTAIVEVPPGENPEECIENCINDMLDMRDTNICCEKCCASSNDERDDFFNDLMQDMYKALEIDENESEEIDDFDTEMQKATDSLKKTSKREYVHYFPSNQPKIDKFLEENPSFKNLEDKYGKCTNVFKDSVTYEKEVDFSPEEVKKWCKLWDNIIKKKFLNFIQENRADFELDKDNALITLWVDDLSKAKFSLSENENVPGKIFFDVKIKGLQVTAVNYDGSIEKTSFHPDEDEITFEYAGEKL